MSSTPALRREILFQLSDVARAMRTYVDQCVRQHGLTRAQWGVLLRLEREEGMMQAEMAESLEIQPISLVRLLDRLCDQKLVERRPHPRDRRAYRLYLTAIGRTTLDRLVPLGRKISGDLLGSLDEAEAGEFLEQLLRIKSNIRKSSAANGAGGRHANGMRHAG
jgi:MarR family transcriptional regulator, transcriptional regulator for hemolysin